MNMQTLILVGRATRDGEEFVSKKEKKFSKFSLAVNEYKGKDAEEKVTFYDVVVFGKLSEKVAERVNKGDLVMVIGKPEVEAYISKKDNEPKGVLNVVAESWNVVK